MLVKNVKVFNKNGTFDKKDIYVEDGRFVSVGNTSTIIDGNGCYMIPGLIDIHFHGCMGADASDGDADAVKTICRYELSNGITSICPATMTVELGELKRALANVAEHIDLSRENKNLSRIVGVNLEGPFISADKAGAHKTEHIKECDLSLFDVLYETADGNIKIVDIAPEKVGAKDFIKEVSKKTIVSVAHTGADYDVAMEAFESGASHVTHLYNAMTGMQHRNPGVVGAALENGHVMVEMICDGIHVHKTVIKATFSMFGADRIVLISDSMRATGLSDGEYMLGGQKVLVKGKRARLEDGTIAGSVVNLMDALRFLVREVSIPLEDVVRCATVNPAMQLGIFDEVGSIDEGKLADFVLLDEELMIKSVYKEGTKVI